MWSQKTWTSKIWKKKDTKRKNISSDIAVSVTICLCVALRNFKTFKLWIEIKCVRNFLVEPLVHFNIWKQLLNSNSSWLPLENIWLQKISESKKSEFSQLTVTVIVGEKIIIPNWKVIWELSLVIMKDLPCVLRRLSYATSFKNYIYTMQIRLFSWKLNFK